MVSSLRAVYSAVIQSKMDLTSNDQGINARRKDYTEPVDR